MSSMIGAEIFPLRHRARCVGVSTMRHGRRYDDRKPTSWVKKFKVYRHIRMNDLNMINLIEPL